MKIVKLLLLSLLTSLCSAEEFVVPIAGQGQYLGKVDRPLKGLDQSSVRQQYGEPTAINGPSGEPPITRWSYKDFSVYFEGDAVIHTVLKHRRQVVDVVTEQP